MYQQIQIKRKEKGLHQRELADICKVRQSTISMWETGRSRPRAKMLLRLAEVLGCTVDELLREDAPDASNDKKGA